MLDGDNVRHGLNRDLGFTDADRVENIRRVGEVAKLFVDAGMVVLCSFISPFRAERQMVRELRRRWRIYRDLRRHAASKSACVATRRASTPRRKEGKIKNFTGIDSPYEPPVAPELHLETRNRSPEDLAGDVLNLLRERGLIP